MSEENAYNYPLDTEHWSTDEIIDVVNFYKLVEQAYEKGVKQYDLMQAYTKFKQVVPSKSEEKKLGSQFEKESGYSLYQIVKEARNTDSNEVIKV
ncbi:hypothetical protein GLW08_02310 [Pontibacillus yanchengensis]|uniref:Uncharacterized protein n=2 Tax=Pontibacillus yanchengensis TaxID=462910 RepID=A0ACC7VBQ0_9BACI|nr:UPF0223 family protein [Pontibacillus yanchengensis]MYL32983.1 hypothetical protein [Pontibacillus yanchengensis]MYL52167.1 hypothetical protein [Pontibacillus yanchengensis]